MTTKIRESSFATETYQVNKTFNNIVAVNGIDLNFNNGKLFALLCPSGAGKTTTVNMLSSLLKLISDTVIIMDYDINPQLFKIQETIGVSTQDTILSKLLNPKENLDLISMAIVSSIYLAFFIFFLTSLFSTGISMVLISLSKSENQANPLYWLFSIPLAMLSGYWFSIEKLTSYIRNVAYVFPVFHSIETARAIFTRRVEPGAILTNFFFLFDWAIIIFTMGIIFSRKNMRS
jgi:energy-coupling factor transporter ATP-binding protein EcfA2